FYELQTHLEQGYQLFSAWDEEIIWLHIKSVDLRLRDEMLRFANRYLRPGSKFYDERLAEQVSGQIVDADNAIRCIEREINDGNHKQAIELGKTILSSSEPVFAGRIANDVLYRSRVLYACAEASLYAGSPDATRQYLEEVIRLLKPYSPADDA